MAIVNPGEKLPAAYLEKFDPAENVAYRFSVLSTSALATEHHWVDVPSKNIKGVYQCIQGVCCQAMGRRMQNYNVPIYVYRQAGSVEGDIYVWQMTPARWKKFSDMVLGGVDLLNYDLFFTAQRRGQGMDWNYSACTDYKSRDYWTPEQKQQLEIAVNSFYQMGESSLVNPMSFNEWNQLLYDIGYDVQNQCWPGGQSPMNSGASFNNIRGAVGAGSVLPPPPPSGFVPSLPHPNSAGVIFQPAPLTALVPIPASPVPVVNSSAPASYVHGQGVPIRGSTVLAPQGGVVSHLMSPPVSSAVPLGTAPVIPQQSQTIQPQVNAVSPATNQPQVQLQGSAPTQPVMQNSVQPVQTQEITAEELNNLLA